MVPFYCIIDHSPAISVAVLVFGKPVGGYRCAVVFKALRVYFFSVALISVRVAAPPGYIINTQFALTAALNDSNIHITTCIIAEVNLYLGPGVKTSFVIKLLGQNLTVIFFISIIV